MSILFSPVQWVILKFHIITWMSAIFTSVHSMRVNVPTNLSDLNVLLKVIHISEGFFPAYFQFINQVLVWNWDVRVPQNISWSVAQFGWLLNFFWFNMTGSSTSSALTSSMLRRSAPPRQRPLLDKPTAPEHQSNNHSQEQSHEEGADAVAK